MGISRLQAIFTTPVKQRLSAPAIFWFSLSLTFAAIYGYLSLRQVFGMEYIVQDDVRQHVFWMERFRHPELFPNDLIANYFQSVAPTGYTTLYWLMSALGIDPIVASKVLPPVLGLITTAYCFGVSMQIFPVPFAGFVSALLLNQCMWTKSDLASATPRAFVFPLFLAFAYYLLRSAIVPCLISIALIGLFYPQYIFIAAGVLVLRCFEIKNRRLQLVQDRSTWTFNGAGLAIAFVVVAFYALNHSSFGPTMSVAEAKTLPEFLPGGRAPFFHTNAWEFWVDGRGSGFLPSLMPVLVYFGLLLPGLLQFPQALPLRQQVTPKVHVLTQILLTSVFMFLAAHAVLFKLHLPSRYTGNSFRIVLSLAAGIAIVLLLDGLFQVALRTSWGRGKQQSIAIATTVLLVATLVLYPSFVPKFPNAQYIEGDEPDLYKFFAQQPIDTMIVSLAKEGDNLPTYSQRSILTGEEYAIPYHAGYYRQFRQRTLEAIAAQYSPDLSQIQQFTQKYGVDFWLLDRKAFDLDYVQAHRWIKQYQPAATDAVAHLQQGQAPILKQRLAACTVFQQEKLLVVQADCVVGAAS
ncbi:hypothetical protein [Pantanalinema sp. GBBB05]|uniref:hypothetical protein n=1 Tax=Pantanalinema sp. GBBB05 TaxID=2604139 RepID=UPI001DB1AE5E|nr:hypothetical protein [Pantanalinema sp. GBBB05]